jgi:hypothetical protein
MQDPAAGLETGLVGLQVRFDGFGAIGTIGPNTTAGIGVV